MSSGSGSVRKTDSAASTPTFFEEIVCVKCAINECWPEDASWIRCETLSLTNVSPVDLIQLF